MKKLVLCGCSLGASWMPYFGPRELWTTKKKYRVNYTEDPNKDEWNVDVFQYGGIGNGMFLHSLLNYFMINEIKDTTIVVQFTGINRVTPVLDGEPSHGEDIEGTRIKNNLTDTSDFYLIDKHCRMRDFGRDSISANNNFGNLVSLLCMLSKLGAKVYVFRGWTGVCDPKHWVKSLSLFKEAGVVSTQSAYLDLAMRLSKSQNEWIDELHPGKELGTKTFAQIWKRM